MSRDLSTPIEHLRSAETALAQSGRSLHPEAVRAHAIRADVHIRLADAIARHVPDPEDTRRDR